MKKDNIIKGFDAFNKDALLVIIALRREGRISLKELFTLVGYDKAQTISRYLSAEKSLGLYE